MFLLILLLMLFVLGAAKGFIRWRVISIPLAGYRKQLRSDMLAHVFLWPFASLLYLYNTIVAGFSRQIEWRGITYELKSPTEAVIILGAIRSTRVHHLEQQSSPTCSTS